jgi:GTPase
VRQEIGAVEFHELGLGDPIPVSAMRGLNTGDLLDAIVDALPPAFEEEVPEPEAPRLAIIGRPNVGKSSLVNALTGEKRSVVSPVPGTTRDAIDTLVTLDGEPVVLVDTAGIRRRGRIGHGIERYSVLRAMRAVDRADVAVLVIDATEPIAAQDAHIAGFVREQGKGMVVAVNKWDLVPKESHTMAEYERRIREELKFMPYVPVVFISAKTGQRIENVIRLALQIQAERKKRISTGVLNETVRRALGRHQPPSFRGRQTKLLYVTQVSTDPPTFVVKVNDATEVHFSYSRFLENRLREQFGFFGTPIRILLRGREGRERAS